MEARSPCNIACLETCRDPTKRIGLLPCKNGIEIGKHSRRRPVLWADDFAVDTAVAIDHIRLGNHHSAVAQGDMTRGIAKGREVHVVRSQEIFVSALIFVDADAKNRTAVRRKALLQLIERGRFIDTGW